MREKPTAVPLGSDQQIGFENVGRTHRRPTEDLVPESALARIPAILGVAATWGHKSILEARPVVQPTCRAKRAVESRTRRQAAFKWTTARYPPSVCFRT
jgi:hypothetical protein